MNRDVLRRKRRQRHHQRPQQHCTPVDHDETSAICEGTEIRLTVLRNFRCDSSVEKFRTRIFMSASVTCRYSFVMPETLPPAIQTAPQPVLFAFLERRSGHKSPGGLPVAPPTSSGSPAPPDEEVTATLLP